MSLLRFFMLLSLVVWLGGIIFFAFVAAPVLFAVLPSRDLAGNVVGHVLPLLHWIGIVSGTVFAGTSMVHSRLAGSGVGPLAARHVLIYFMILLTLFSQFAVGPKMENLRTQMGVVDEVAPDDSRRVAFDHLHQWSVRLEGSVLVLGLAALYLTARKLT